MSFVKDFEKKHLRPFLRRLVDEPRDRKEYIMRIVMNAVHVWNLPPGDYLEFGVYEGRSFVYAYKLAQLEGLSDMHFYAFDSFQGLPPVDGIDAEYGVFTEGQYACSEERFLANLKKAGVDLSRVTTVPGYYDDVLNEETRRKLPIERASIVWIDCDIYSSTVPILEFIIDYLMSGTILVFDDWYSFAADPNAGHIKAVREWLAKYPHIKLVEYYKYGVPGLTFIVRLDEDDVLD